jgi:VacB/RNase II family 3'-5' exoribonuclease
VNNASAESAAASENACEDEESKQQAKPVKNLLEGKVVALSKPGHRLDYVGFLRGTRENNSFSPNDKYIIFVPLEKRMPKMLIPTMECSEQFIAEGPAAHSQEMYVATVGEWKPSSNYPIGHLVRHLGKTGNTESEVLAALVENGFDLSIVNYPEVGQEYTGWTIPQEELAKRLDLREERVFSVDPVTAKDLDDAISIKRNGDRFRVGVHIADVSYFVTSGSNIDQEAASRTTSIYLPFGKVLPMLPPILSDDLCSLHENVDRLTFSVFFDLDEDGTLYLDSSTISKSVIRSKARLSYESAQELIHSSEETDLAQDLRDLNRITFNRRKNRLNGDDLISRLNRRPNGKLSFSSDDEKDIIIQEYTGHSNSHEMIEELMLIANFIAATKMLESTLRDDAVLRIHPKPSERRLNEFIELFADRFERENECSQMLDFMRHELNRCTSLAKYIRAGDHDEQTWSHFGLQLHHYTHFTSPIRRYTDIMVHRILNRVVGYEQATVLPAVHQTRDVLERCNMKRSGAKRAEEQSNKALVRAMIANQPLLADAVVAKVAQKSMQVYVPKLGEMVRVNLENENVKLDKKTRVLKFMSGDDESEIQVQQFDVISVELFIVRDSNNPNPEVAARFLR